MTTAAWLAQLEDYQGRLFSAVEQFSVADYNKQYHSELSPAGWHLGHCLFTENYWLREVILEQEADEPELKSLYIPELSPKTGRGGTLPDFKEMCSWVSSSQSKNRNLLRQLADDANTHPLLKDNYFYSFLCQHYAQHYETVVYILAQRQLQKAHSFDVAEILKAKTAKPDYQKISAGKYAIGNEDVYCPYDNEGPRFKTELDEFHIARNPVSNAEFLTFMQDGGYDDKKYWSEKGWNWLSENRISQPENWRLNTSEQWYSINEHGACTLKADMPVHGINHYEASAFANWAGARLPHEYEWEVAQRLGLLNMSGKVWEWCANTFHPYTGFEAFPYDGYSLPYFDDEHYTLRGASSWTQDVIRRASFRNYYQADKRHQLSGLRLAYG